MSDFFEDESAPQRKAGKSAPLAERMRPLSLDEFAGQEEIAGSGSPLRKLIESDKLPSLIFWGPPGCGKTTLAAIIAASTKAQFVSLSAVTASIKDVKAVMEQARTGLERSGRRTILFIDEIHRFNKAQQDAFLPFVEDGSIILIGATTENPSFSLISALLSRCRIFVLKALTEHNLTRILRDALENVESGLGAKNAEIAPELLSQIAQLSDGDARRALNLLELAVRLSPKDGSGKTIVSEESLKQVLQRQHLIYDKAGEEHYNIISALHKSMRGSDPQGAVYWSERMLASGEDPLYLARRMIRFASEDIGNADPQALSLSIAAREAYRVLGTPEGELALIQCAIYLATAPKSNAAYRAESAAKQEIAASGSLPVPFHIRNAPTSLMKGLGYGAGYKYDHDAEGAIAGQDYLPDSIRSKVFYEPGPYGFEKEIAKRIEWWEKQRAEGKKQP